MKREPSEAQVQRQTTWTWAKRAIRYRKRAERESGERRREWMRRFDDARHEALEHAALVGDSGKTVARVQAAIDVPKRRSK